jgi:phage terminase large subunit
MPQGDTFIGEPDSMVNQEKEALFTQVFELNRDSKAKIIINVGGAGSGKSHALAQLFIYKLLTEQNKLIGICRKTFPALRMTAMATMIELLKSYGIYDERKHNKTFNTYEYNSNMIQWFSLDQSEKIKSTNFSYLWLEEGNEFTYEDYMVLKLRLRAPVKPGELNQMFISLNPSDSTSWVAKLCGEKQSV